MSSVACEGSHMKDFGGVGLREPPYTFPLFRVWSHRQHSSILGVEPYCGLTVHQAEVLVPEPPPLGDPVAIPPLPNPHTRKCGKK